MVKMSLFKKRARRAIRRKAVELEEEDDGENEGRSVEGEREADKSGFNGETTLPKPASPTPMDASGRR